MNPVDVRGLQKSFDGQHVLHGVDLHVEPGEILGFVGPNGAGKTTLLRALIGLTRRDGGQVLVLGMDPARKAVQIRRRVSYLPGETSIYRNMTGARFLDFATRFYSAQVPGLRDKFRDVFPLPLRSPVRTYSAGMKQQLALMATLLPDVDLYILDEPDRALDASTRLSLRDLLATLKSNGKSVLLSSHNLTEVEAVADRMLFLMAGHNIARERVESVRADLRKHVRVQLRHEVELPADVEFLRKEIDGTLTVRCERDPMAWLSRIPADDIISAEVGTIRLEELYQRLTDEEPVS